jgi:predicted SAM-dependent methyltransferase
MALNLFVFQFYGVNYKKYINIGGYMLKLKIFVMKIINIIFSIAHNLLKKLGVLNFINIYGVGEKNIYGNNPFLTTIDVNDSDHNMIISMDSKLPITSKTARIIYSAHCLEHLPLEVVNNFFADVHECLIQSGELLLELPDAEFLYNIYRSGNWTKIPELKSKSYHDECKHDNDDPPYKTFLNVLVFYFPTKLEVGKGKSPNISEKEFNKNFTSLNMDDFFAYCIGKLSLEQLYSGGHVSIWYPKKIIKMLEKHGFNAEIRGYRESRTLGFFGKLLIPDRKHRSDYSFRISAVKS